MSSLSGITKIDSQGRCVIPSQIRKHLNIKDNQVLAICTEGGNVIIKLNERQCSFCGTTRELHHKIGNNYICSSCMYSIEDTERNSNYYEENH